MTAAAATRTRLERVRASVGIAQLAFQQIEDDLGADDVDQAELAAILRELIKDTDPPAGQCLIWAANSLHPQGDPV